MERKGPRGKVFTDVIRKIPVRATIRTVHEFISGTIHLLPDQRTLDALNGQKPFLAVTDAEVETRTGIIRTAFLAVNKAHILWVDPDDNAGEVHGSR